MTQAPGSGSGRNDARRGGRSTGSDGAGRGRPTGRSAGGSSDRSAGAGRPQRDDRSAGAGRPQRDDRPQRGGTSPGRGRAQEGRHAAGRPSQGRPTGERSGRPTGERSARPTGDARSFSQPGEARRDSGYRGTGNPAADRYAAAKKSGTGRPARQKPAGPRAFGGERFGQNLGAVRRPKAARTARSADELDMHNPDGIRLQKVMASAGVASRRVCEEMILDGRVEVDGTIVRELGVRVVPSEVSIHVDGMRLQLDEDLKYYVFNKPRGVISTMEDPEGRPSIGNFLKNKNKNERLFHVGRLDAETEGLLLLTNDGELTNRLTHPSYEVPKTYYVQVRGPMGPGIGAQMKEGIELEDGIAKVDSFKLVDSTPGHILVEVVLHSGKNRVVRRLFDAVGHPVERLVRTQVGPIRLNDQRQGSIRVLGRTEVGHLLASVGL